MKMINAIYFLFLIILTIPFADDVSGDIICIDLKDNTIKLVSHETDEIEFVANSLDKFMNSLYE